MVMVGVDGSSSSRSVWSDSRQPLGKRIGQREIPNTSRSGRVVEPISVIGRHDRAGAESREFGNDRSIRVRACVRACVEISARTALYATRRRRSRLRLAQNNVTLHRRRNPITRKLAVNNTVRRLILET